jgi:hypothetical protein
MNKEDWKKVYEVRVLVSEKEDDGSTFQWSFPIWCPRWLLNILIKLEL